MLILGGRYGSTEPISGISYTELEYDYASQQGKPLFAVVIRDDALEGKVKAFGTNMIERENPKGLKLFREKVLANISSFFADDKDTRLCVYESLADLTLNPTVKGWIFAGEVEDTQPLHKEISNLREKLRKAQEIISRTTQVVSEQKSAISIEDFDEVSRILSEIEVRIPASISVDKKETISDLLSLFFDNKDMSINGITNSLGTSNTGQFLCFNVCPKLVVHGLVSNEAVPGVQYRRSCVNRRGIMFLAEMDRKFKTKSFRSKLADV